MLCGEPGPIRKAVGRGLSRHATRTVATLWKGGRHGNYWGQPRAETNKDKWVTIWRQPVTAIRGSLPVRDYRIRQQCSSQSHLHRYVTDNCQSVATVVTTKEQRVLTVLKLTPWRWVLLQKLIVPQLLNKFPALGVTRRFITVFTRARRWSLHWAS
jgi:hypothetical protein